MTNKQLEKVENAIHESIPRVDNSTQQASPKVTKTGSAVSDRLPHPSKKVATSSSSPGEAKDLTFLSRIRSKLILLFTPIRSSVPETDVVQQPHSVESLKVLIYRFLKNLSPAFIRHTVFALVVALCIGLMYKSLPYFAASEFEDLLVSGEADAFNQRSNISSVRQSIVELVAAATTKEIGEVIKMYEEAQGKTSLSQNLRLKNYYDVRVAKIKAFSYSLTPFDLIGKYIELNGGIANTKFSTSPENGQVVLILSSSKAGEYLKIVISQDAMTKWTVVKVIPRDLGVFFK